jgi:hypothetical protein
LFSLKNGKVNVFEKLRDKVALSGIIVLVIGVALLIFTFAGAYGLLTQSHSIVGSADLSRAIGESLPPIITACIHLMFLAVMVWIGSLLTVRGITILQHLPETSTQTAQKPETPQQPETEKKEAEKQPTEPTKPKVKPSEPQIMVIPPETAQITTTQDQPEKKEPQTTS